VLIAGASAAFAAGGYPTTGSEISTDRPDVTNSSRVVPYGSLRSLKNSFWLREWRSNRRLDRCCQIDGRQ